jgi:hypothetical protein
MTVFFNPYFGANFQIKLTLCNMYIKYVYHIKILRGSAQSKLCGIGLPGFPHSSPSCRQEGGSPLSPASPRCLTALADCHLDRTAILYALYTTA